MPQYDLYHTVVKQILMKEGWTITHDPLTLTVGTKRLFVDLGASTLISAEKEERKIAVEIKSFTGHSSVHDLEQALGQYVLYHKILERQEPERILYMAVTETVYDRALNTELGQLVIGDQTLRVLVFDPEKEVILQWIPA